MNSLSKIQVLMWCLLLLVIGAFFLNILLLIPAALLFVLQFFVARSDLKKDYPEDWSKYLSIFLFYELAIIFMTQFVFRVAFTSLSISSFYTMFMAVLVVIIVTIALKYLIGRRSCYGTILFVSGEWAGVAIKTDLFSKVSEADYAVRNSLGIKLKKGDRVRIRLKGTFNRSVPYEVSEVVR